jgi:ATP-dependent Lon protease
LPERNKADLEEVPKEVRDELEFVLVNRLDDVLESGLERMPQPSQAYLDDVAKREAQPSTN